MTLVLASGCAWHIRVSGVVTIVPLEVLIDALPAHAHIGMMKAKADAVIRVVDREMHMMETSVHVCIRSIPLKSGKTQAMRGDAIMMNAACVGIPCGTVHTMTVDVVVVVWVGHAEKPIVGLLDDSWHSLGCVHCADFGTSLGPAIARWNAWHEGLKPGPDFLTRRHPEIGVIVATGARWAYAQAAHAKRRCAAVLAEPMLFQVVASQGRSSAPGSKEGGTDVCRWWHIVRSADI